MEKALEGILDTMEEHRRFVAAALERIPADNLWLRPPDGGNSVGNLCLHLAGNENHYIGACIGRNGYVRDRAGEFNAESGPDAAGLLDGLASARGVTRGVFAALRPEDLDRAVESDWSRASPTVLRMALHVATHYAYHTGQIVLHARRFESSGERVLDWGH